MKLGVNIDHIAVLKQARKVSSPDPLQAVFVCQMAGADQITIHLREDRRHIDDFDAKNIIAHSKLPINMELSTNQEITQIALDLKPLRVTIVPENRAEVTTEGGLDLELKNLGKIIKNFQNAQIKTSLFIEPDINAIKKAKALGANAVELHTGRFANIFLSLYSNLSLTPNKIAEFDKPRFELKKMLDKELERLSNSANLALDLGLFCAAGHGLDYQNTKMLKGLNFQELNIGQSIVARAVFVGLERAILEMKDLISNL